MHSGIILARKFKVLKSVKMWKKWNVFIRGFPVLGHVSMRRLLTWASLLLRGFPEDLRLLGAQRPQASQLLRQLRVGQRQVHPVGRTGRGRHAVKHFIAARAQNAFLFLVTGFLSMEMNQRALLSAEVSATLKVKRSPAPLHRERGQQSALANSRAFRRLFLYF